MSIIDAIINFLQSIFGGKTEQTAEEKQEENVALDPTHILNFIDALIVNCVNLTEEETIDLKEQVQTCCDLGYTKFVIHTTGRTAVEGDTHSGDRYWHCEWMPRAKVMDVMNDSNGYSKEVAVNKGLEKFFIENLLS